MMAFTAVTDVNAADKKKGGNKKKVDKKKKKPKRKGAAPQKQYTLSEIYAKMKFSPEQQVKFDAVQKKLQDELDKWDATANGQKLLELESAVALARTAEDKSALGNAQGQIRRLKAARAAIERRHDPLIVAILTREQKGQRLGYVLCNSVMTGKLGSVLNADQVTKVQANCKKAGVAVARGSLSSARARAALQGFAIGLLSDDQRKKVGLAVKPKKQDKKKGKRRR
jgi:hypothetical protein